MTRSVISKSVTGSRPPAGAYSFESIANRYDETRRLPPREARAIARGIARAARLRSCDRLLEIGVGTGRVAVPLLARGADVVGLDLSPSMMHLFRSKAAPKSPGAVCGDLLALPFKSAAFSAVLGACVFHLVARWRDALDEIRRVLAPGGCLLHSWHCPAPGSVEHELRAELSAIALRRGASIERPGARDAAELIEALTNAGATTRTVRLASWVSATTPGSMIELLRSGAFSYTWSLEPRLACDCIDELEDWASRRFRKLDVSIPFRETFELHVHEFPKRSRRSRSGARLLDASSS